jgi:ectoine hydroxylase-related dioxygenase (phytanoyl-CoA dioxygenase family)
MDIGDWKATRELSTVYRRARELGLESNIAELDAFGFTIVPPEKAAPPGFAQRFLERTMAVVAAEDPMLVDTFKRADRAAAGRQLYHLLEKDPIFIEALMSPVALTLAKYMMGDSCRLSSTVALVKEGPSSPTVMHTDSIAVPPPLPYFGSVLNASWILTDYRKETGTFYVVPGSHRYCRHPTKQDQPTYLGGTADDDLGIPIDARPGSLFVFHGNLWHATYPKLDDALRVHVIMMFCRNYMQPSEDLSDLSDETVQAHGPEFARLVSREAWQGYASQGPNIDRMRAVDRLKITPTA